MIGRLVSVERGPERNVRLIVTPKMLASEISIPTGPVDPALVESYSVVQTIDSNGTLSRLHFVLTDGGNTCFYSTYSMFDLALLLDQLDATIGERPRTLFAKELRRHTTAT